MYTKPIRLLLSAIAAALTLTSCGGTDHNGHDSAASKTSITTPAGPTAAGAHNDADVAFATGMIPHHAQAIMMSDQALRTATNAEVKALATAIKAAQDPEIATMSGWLRGWGKPVPDTMGHAGHDMAGMMSAEEMDQLAKASGAAFDRMWLDMMIRHHEGAVSMSQTELADGSSGDAKALAQAIIDGQTKEISAMRTLLAGTLG